MNRQISGLCVAMMVAWSVVATPLAGASGLPPVTTTGAGAPAKSGATTCTDFNHDGRDDLAVGAPGNLVDGHANAGSVNVIYGSASGLTATNNRAWTKNEPGVAGTAAAGDNFGRALAQGDFNFDGFCDLAIGAPFAANGGTVTILFGSATGLNAAGSQELTQASPGVPGDAENGDRFGWALASGDFNDDGRDDLAIGAPFEDVNNNTIDDAGAVIVLYGSANGWQDDLAAVFYQGTPGVPEVEQEDDNFGHSLAVGDFNGDGHDDLAVGAPYDSQGGVAAAGVVNILYGSDEGLAAAGAVYFSQNSFNLAGVSHGSFDLFGWSLAAGDFGNDTFDDLAIGAPYDTVGNIDDAGAVHVVYGSANGLTTANSQYWSQASQGIQETAATGDRFGYALAAGNFDATLGDDLAIGAPREHIDLNPNFYPDAGAVHVLYSCWSLPSPPRLCSANNQLLYQSAQNIPGTVAGALEAHDHFGQALAIGNFDGGSYDDLVIGAPDENIEDGSIADAGAVNVLYGSASRLTANNDEVWSQASNGIDGNPHASDRFGFALGTR